MNIAVYDDLVDEPLARTTFEWLTRQTMLFGWRARSDSQGTFWHRNYVLPGTYEHHYDPSAVNPAADFSTFLAAQTPLSTVAKLVSDQFFEGRDLTRVWVNAQSFGDEAGIHRDFPIQFAGRARTLVWYPVPQWDPEWGGDFSTFDDNGEILGSVVIRPNRALVFDSTTRHAARPISRYCNALRVAVSFALEVASD